MDVALYTCVMVRAEDDPLGEMESRCFQRSFNSSLHLAYQDANMVSDGGQILVRDLASRLAAGKSRACTMATSSLAVATDSRCSIARTTARLPRSVQRRLPRGETAIARNRPAAGAGKQCPSVAMRPLPRQTTTSSCLRVASSTSSSRLWLLSIESFD